jgi:mannose-6-phosphate isomerase-like protein (cupin superfamily)
LSIRIRKLSEEPGIEESGVDYCRVNSVWLVLKRVDLTGFSCRVFRIEPGGHTGMQAHEGDHVAVVINGTCRVEYDTRMVDVQEASIITIPSKVTYRFSNPSRERLVMLLMDIYANNGTSLM